MSILPRSHNSDPGREKAPRPVRERLAKINVALTSTIQAVQFEKSHGFLPGSGDKLFPTTYGKWITGHEVVSKNHTKDRIAKAAPVVAESIDKMEVTAKPSGQIDLNEKHLVDPDLFDAMAKEKAFEAKADGPKLGAQDMPDADTSAPDSEEDAKVYRIEDARKQVQDAREAA